MLERCRAPQDGCTLLHVAAQEGHASVVELLLAAGADTDAKNAVRVPGSCGMRIGEGQKAESFFYLFVGLRPSSGMVNRVKGA